METVTVTVPDGIYEGQEFLLEYEGQQLAVICPDGCAGGDDIDLEVPIATGGAAAPNLVDVAVPEGCFAGSEFTVTFGDQEFNITVPDGVNPGEMMTVEVPAPALASTCDERFKSCVERPLLTAQPTDLGSDSNVR